MAALIRYAGIPCQPSSLEAILASRDARQTRQAGLREKTGLPLLSMTLNLPGPVKRTPLSSFFFDSQLEKLTRLLRGLGARIEAREVRGQDQGDEAILAVRGLTAAALKDLAVTLESEEEASRLLDLDVLTPEGDFLKRTDRGLAARRCLLCDQAAFLCSSRQAHPLQALEEKVEGLLLAYAEKTLTDDLTRLALEAASFELMVAPKPGLVTPFDPGSHPDMDRFTFTRSQAALAAYYGSAFGLGWVNRPLEDLALRLRHRGLLAEAAMEEATGGVNTHRGWIYLAGILLAAAGRYSRSLFQGQLGEAPMADMAALSGRLAAALEEGLVRTAHLDCLAKRGGAFGDLAGIRQEALAGFPCLFELGLPLLTHSSQRGEGDNRAGQRALLALLVAADDSTLRKRAGLDQAGRIRRELGEELSSPSLLEGVLALTDAQVDRLMEALSDRFRKDHLTCGGAADLLAASRLMEGFHSRLVMDL